MKEFKIEGVLIVDENLDHQEFIHMLYEMLSTKGFFFKGETKEIVKN